MCNRSIFIILLWVWFSSASCTQRTRPDDPVSRPANTNQSPDRFKIENPKQFPTCPVEQRELADEVEVNGVVAPDVNRTVHITSMSGGRVVEIRTRLGDEVKEGQVLLVVNSQDLASANSDYRKFSADEVLLKRALERTQLLYEHGAAALKDLQQAQDAGLKAGLDRASAAQRIRLLGGDPEHLSSVLEIKAPMSGTVVEQNTTSGEGIKSLDSSPNLFTVADLSRVWVLCDVYENFLSRVRLGDHTEIRFNAYPDKVFSGRISNISRILDPATRTVKVRVELDNSQGWLRPGMFAVAKLKSREKRRVLVIPLSAVMRLHDKDWAFVREDDFHFRRVEIKSDSSLPQGYTVVSGLNSNDIVIANALQFASFVEK